MSKKEQVLKQYLKIVKEVGKRSPALSEMKAKDLSRATIREHWGTRLALDEAARESKPSFFKDVPLSDFSGDLYIPDGGVILTSAVVGCKAHIGFIKALADYAKYNFFTVWVLPVADPAAKVSPNGIGRIDKAIIEAGFQVVTNDQLVNNNLKVLGISLSAKQINPLTGLKRFGNRGTSCVVASPKQMLDVVATNGEFPHVLMTPGACTLPNYGTETYRSKRTAYLADQDHVIGAVIVEVETEDIFHYRQIQAGANGSFYDLNSHYSGSKKKPARPEAIVMGDWHSWTTADACKDFALDNPYDAKDIYLHDSFDGATSAVNHHAKGRGPSQKGTPNSLFHELVCWGDDLEALSEQYRKVYIVRSNHDDRIDTWLESGEFIQDPVNFDLGCELLRYYRAGDNCLEKWFSSYYRDKNVVFLKRNEPHRVGGVDLSPHGDKGANGAKSLSLHKADEIYGPCVIGHNHSPGICRNAFRVGTSSILNPGYTKRSGASSWMHTHCLVHKDGSRQLINLLPEELTQ